jgi:hypothetical protein
VAAVGWKPACDDGVGAVARLKQELSREFHVYTAEWTPTYVAFFVDHRLVKTVAQSPAYPMQLMLGIYEFPDDAPATRPARRYPKQFVVDYVGGYRPPGRNRPRTESGSSLRASGLPLVRPS